MRKILIFTTIAFLLTSVLYAKDYRLPVPPSHFFAKLSKTTLPPGKGCCSELRRILVNSVTISPYLAANLFRQGKLLIGDTRLSSSYKDSHVFGAISLPYNEVDFMKLKRLNKPIALY